MGNSPTSWGSLGALITSQLEAHEETLRRHEVAISGISADIGVLTTLMQGLKSDGKALSDRFVAFIDRSDAASKQRDEARFAAAEKLAIYQAQVAREIETISQKSSRTNALIIAISTISVPLGLLCYWVMNRGG